MKDAVDILNEQIAELKMEAMQDRASYEAEIARLRGMAKEVYVAIQNYWEWRELIGVYSTRYRAKKAVERLGNDPKNCSIIKVKVDEVDG